MNSRPIEMEIYKHFKGGYYQILCIALDTETSREVVVYRQLFEPYKTYVRPLGMFMEEVDIDKYPDIKQKYRFEKVTNIDGNTNSIEKTRIEETKVIDIKAEGTKVGETKKPSPIVIEFLDANTYDEKIEILDRNKDMIDETMLAIMATSLDQRLGNKGAEEQIKELRYGLQAKKNFECKR